jgi:hypothetical protein
MPDNINKAVDSALALGRRQVAIKMLEEYAQAQMCAMFYEQYANQTNADFVYTANVLHTEAEMLRDEILVLMGVDDTPAATLEVDDGQVFAEAPGYDLNKEFPESDAFHFGTDPFLPSDEDQDAKA